MIALQQASIVVLTLKLTPELEQRLRDAACERGLAVEAYTLEVLDRQLPRADRQIELVSLLQIWLDEPSSSEETQTDGTVIRALDEDRLSDRSLFPPELKGVTW